MRHAIVFRVYRTAADMPRWASGEGGGLLARGCDGNGVGTFYARADGCGPGDGFGCGAPFAFTRDRGDGRWDDDDGAGYPEANSPWY